MDLPLRHPLSSHYSAGQGAIAVASKNNYTGRQGLRVWLAAMVIYRKHNNDLADLLVADLARQRDQQFSHAPQRWLRRWRIQLSAMAAKLVGRVVQQA